MGKSKDTGVAFVGNQVLRFEVDVMFGMTNPFKREYDVLNWIYECGESSRL